VAISKQIARSIDLATEGKAAEREGGVEPTWERMTGKRGKKRK